MNPMMSGAAGGFGGSMLGQTLDAFGAPRRGIASALRFLMPQSTPSSPYDFNPPSGGASGIPDPGAPSMLGVDGQPGAMDIQSLLGGGSSPGASNSGSLLPLLLGGMGGAAAGYFSGGAAAPLGFAAGTGLGQFFNELAGGRENAEDMTDIFGDQGMLGNFAMNAAADPLTYAGIFSGPGVAKGVGGMMPQGGAFGSADDMARLGSVVERDASTIGAAERQAMMAAEQEAMRAARPQPQMFGASEPPPAGPIMAAEPPAMPQQMPMAPEPPQLPMIPEPPPAATPQLTLADMMRPSYDAGAAEGRLGKLAAYDRASIDPQQLMSPLREDHLMSGQAMNPTPMATPPSMSGMSAVPSGFQPSPMPPSVLGGYSMEDLQTLLPGIQLEPGAGAARSFGRINPQANELLAQLGFLDEGGAVMGGAPPWLKGRGGVMSPVTGDQMSNMLDLIGQGGSGPDARARMLQRLMTLQG